MPWFTKPVNKASSETMCDLRVMDESSFEGEWNVIGAGGGGQIFKARHRQLGKDVAIKIIGLLGDAKDDKLASEAEAMLRAESIYIVKVRGVFKGHTPQNPGNTSVGLVMDLMDRGSLQSLQKKRELQPLPWPLVFRLVHQVAKGMEYLHSLEPALIHKDIKPDNILLDSDLNVKITDFGIAKFAGNVTADRLKGVRTEFYAPPESFQGAVEGGASTTAYDVFSYAVVVWTILNPVFNDKFPVNVSEGERPSLEEVQKMEAPGLKELVELMKECWNQDPMKRPTFAKCTAVTQRLYEKNQSGIDVHVQMAKLEQDGVVILTEPIRDFERLTLDTNTTYRKLSLSENNRTVTGCDGQDHSYPDHDDRFDVWPQVLCTESLTGRCYWEVEWSGGVGIAVTYRGISRTGKGRDCVLGGNDKSWSLECSDRWYVVTHNSEVTVLSVSPSGSNRAAVYVDHPAGTLSFYEVSSDTLTHLYSFQTKFIEPLFAGFGLPFASSSTVCLCDQVRSDSAAQSSTPHI